MAALEALVDPDTRGDPQSPLRWTCKSTRTLAEVLSEAGHPVSSWTVAKLLGELGYSLQADAKVREGAGHPDRDAQFRCLGAQVQAQLNEGRLMVGQYKNGGRDWQPKGEPVEVDVHGFAGRRARRSIPYGVYDAAAGTGWVSVGTDHDTAAFAVATLRRWWEAMGAAAYPDARRLLVCADGGGSDSSRSRLWKAELARMAADTGLAVTVCRLPPGTSKWNRVEHRLFAHISMSWRGRPLESHVVVY